MIYSKIFVLVGELKTEAEPRTCAGQQLCSSAPFSGLSWAGVVRLSAELLSISTQRLSASAIERLVTILT